MVRIPLFRAVAPAMLAVALAIPVSARAQCKDIAPLHLPQAWKELTFDGIAGNQFSVDAEGIRIVSENSASMLYADIAGAMFETLSWTWSSDGDMPASDLRKKGGDDRRIAVSVAFDYRDPNESIFKKAMRGMLEAIYGAGLPGRVISYTWASGNDAGEVFDNPYSGADGKTLVLRGAGDTGQLMETVKPGDDYVRLFGETPPPVSFVAVFSDTDDTGTRLVSRVSNLCLR